MVLLVGAGLMMRGFLREQRDLPGFDTTRLLTADILLGGTNYFDKTPQDMNLVTRAVRDLLRSAARAGARAPRRDARRNHQPPAIRCVDASVHHRGPAGSGSAARNPPPT